MLNGRPAGYAQSDQAIDVSRSLLRDGCDGRRGDMTSGALLKMKLVSNAARMPDSVADDLQLVAGADRAALRRVYDVTSPRLYVVCAAIIARRETIEDVLEQVYLEVWNRAAQFDRKQGHSLGWLTRIARERAICAARAIRGGRVQEDASGIPGLLVNSAEAPLVPDAEFSLFNVLTGAEELSSEHIRQIYVRGLSYRELANRYGVPLDTVKSKVRRFLVSFDLRANAADRSSR